MLPPEIRELGHFDQVTFSDGTRHYELASRLGVRFRSVTSLLTTEIPEFCMNKYYNRVGGIESANENQEFMVRLGNLFDSAVQQAVANHDWAHPALSVLGYPQGTKFYAQIPLVHHKFLYMGTADLFALDPDGEWHVIDTKAWSKFYDSDSEKEDEGLGLLDRTLSQSKVDKARKQLCLYALAFESMTGIKVKNLSVSRFNPHTFHFELYKQWQYQSNRTQKSIRETLIPMIQSGLSM
jgi:hypothetical protein